jgi:RNA polymerase sigma-70 factor (ECF subfamily)
MTAGDLPPLQGAALTETISAAPAKMYGEFYGHDRTDEALMVRAQAGDTDAFAQLYGCYSERALRIARAICRDQSCAEDAVQEGFLAIWRSRADYRPEAGSFQAWSMRIVKHRAIDSSRRVAARPRTQTDDAYDDQLQFDPNPTTPQGAAVAQSEREGLIASLRQLPEAQTEVIVLAFFGELSHSEIAALLELPPGTVKGRMRLGLEKLRREMEVADAG